ncbi:SigB/SigF/SigG family RNA polymerase sigma factor [Streptomyces sp. NPDC048362]|uniref:SigB/SigF/SigG family RNA polymerase sigma factor n=1 Tax=Streptomyces sp. NPDC048362 TaxID=3365539 RepID=UPI003710E8A8
MAPTSSTALAPHMNGLPKLPTPAKITSAEARKLSQSFFRQFATLQEGTPEYQNMRNMLIEMNISLVIFSASRFRSRRPGEMEDIIQVGMIGLIKAIDRFDLSRGVEFASFAVPFIVGEIKRFFRDSTWAVHVPRRLQEARIQLSHATEELLSRLGRTPTIQELSEAMSLPEEEVREARLAANAYSTASLDAVISRGNEGETTAQECIGTEDRALQRVEDLHSLASLVADLCERDQQIIYLRFVEELSQAQIGKRLGISQMHVSRLLSRVLHLLREGMLSSLQV